MTTILCVGQTLLLPSRTRVVVMAVGLYEVDCVFGPDEPRRGEVTFNKAWLQRFAIVVDGR